MSVSAKKKISSVLGRAAVSEKLKLKENFELMLMLIVFSFIFLESDPNRHSATENQPEQHSSMQVTERVIMDQFLWPPHPVECLALGLRAPKTSQGSTLPSLPGPQQSGQS